MKIFISWATLILGALTSFGQSEIAFVDTGNVQASCHLRGALFQSFDNTSSPNGFVVPKDSGTLGVFASNFWIAGKSENGFVGAGGKYDRVDSEFPAFQFGPIANDYGQTAFQKYKRVWHLDKVQIEHFLDSFDIETYVIPEVILNYPGNGDVSNGESSKLAPFMDVNNDGIYNPEDGDYPELRGDEMVYAIFNADIINPDFGFDPAPFEFHLRLYSFVNEGKEMKNSVFINLRVVNRGEQDVADAYVGTWNDFDIGGFADDYIGCDTTHNMFYGYNADNFDNDGFLEWVPAVGAIYLNNTMVSHVSFFNGGGPMGSPSSPEHMYNYLRGYWGDNSPITYGEQGFGGDTETRYMYFGDPVTETGWTEFTSNNFPGDRQTISGVGPFTFPSDGEICFDLAYVYGEPTEPNSYANGIIALRRSATKVRNRYLELGLACDSIEIELVDFWSTKDSVCPGEEVLFHSISERFPVDATWDFPGGTPSEYVGLTPPPIKYNEPGNYPVSLSVEFVSGNTRTRTYSNKIVVSEGLDYDFTANWTQYNGDCAIDSVVVEFEKNPVDPEDTFLAWFEGGEGELASSPYTIVPTGNGQNTYYLSASINELCYFPQSQTITFTPVPVDEVLEGFIAWEEGQLKAYPEGYLYSWYLNGDLLVELSADNTWLPTEEGEYTVEIINESSGCSTVTESYYFDPDFISENGFSTTSQIVPNPNSGVFQLIPQASVYQIYSLEGKLLKQGQVNSNEIQLDATPAGVYIVEWEDVQGQRYFQRLLIE